VRLGLATSTGPASAGLLECSDSNPPLVIKRERYRFGLRPEITTTRLGLRDAPYTPGASVTVHYEPCARALNLRVAR